MLEGGGGGRQILGKPFSGSGMRKKEKKEGGEKLSERSDGPSFRSPKGPSVTCLGFSLFIKSGTGAGTLSIVPAGTRTVPYEGDNFANSEMDNFSLTFKTS